MWSIMGERSIDADGRSSMSDVDRRPIRYDQSIDDDDRGSMLDCQLSVADEYCF